MALLYADEHLPVQVVYRLRRLGHDVLTVRQTSRNKSGDAVDDEHVLIYATMRNRAVVTENCADFRRLHCIYPGHKGIIACRQHSDWKAQAKMIDAAIRAVLAAQKRLDGQYIRVPSDEQDETRSIRGKRRRPKR
jgi:hypothetical protein